jgi:Xaa-Pro aminopeptidase
MLSDKKEGTGETRSRTPNSKEFLDYISSGWQDSPVQKITAAPAADFAKVRRDAVAKAFSNQVIVIAAGAPKTRSNDTEYRYRPHAAFAHLTGWGSQTVPDSVLVIDTEESNQILFLRPTAGKDSDEFFANPAIGEFWVGARPTLEEVSSLLKIATRDLAELDDYLGKKTTIDLEDAELAQFVSELRLVKDSFEIEQMRAAVEILKLVPASELIWASPRELLNIFQADEIGCQVITVTNEILKKLSLVGYDLDEYSLDTVNMFYNDAVAAGFKL